MSAWAQAEVERILANMIRVGVIAELDQANARVKVNVSGVTTDWLPWTTARAGATRTWSAPRAGEQVLVLSPHGDLAQGVVVPSIYQDDHPAPANTQDKETTVYPDGSTVEYNSDTNTLTVTVSGDGKVIVNCKEATVNAETSVTLDTPLVHCMDALTVEGLLTYKGGMTGSGGSGASLTGALNVTGNVATTGTVQNNGVNIGSTHTHAGVQTGGGNTAVPH